jgi:predicted RNA binding protein YcfA (HicA-like mRNA interferase family)
LFSSGYRQIIILDIESFRCRPETQLLALITNGGAEKDAVGELRDVRPRDAIAALERAGGLVRHGKGDHVNIKMPNGQIITLSGTRAPIKIGLLKAMLRKAGLTESECVLLLKGDK